LLKELKTELTTQLKTELKRDLTWSLRPDLALEQAIKRQYPSLLVPDASSSILAGASQTLSFATAPGDTRVAVGAAHCHLYSPTNPLEPGHTRVYVPQHIAALVTKVRVPEGLLGREYWNERDIVMFELKEFPEGVTPEEVPELNLESSPTGFIGDCCALSPSVNVRGHSLVAIDGGKVYAFVEDAGEPGNSGALVFTASNDDEHRLMPIGTYFGIPNNAHATKLRPRGLVVPLRALKTSTDLDVVGSPTFTPHEAEKLGGADGVFKDSEGYSFVFVAAPSLFNGRAVCGALGCGRAK